MNSSYNSHHHDGANGSTGTGGTKVMSLLEEVDAFISQKDAAAPVSSGSSSSIMAGPSSTMMTHHPSKKAATATTTHPCKRRISADSMEDTNSNTRCQHPSSSSSSNSSTASSSDVATDAVAAFLQNQVQQASPQEQQQQHRSKRQRRDEDPRSLSLSPKTLGGLDSFALDLHMPVSESSFGSNDNEPLPIFPPQQEPPLQQQQQPPMLQLQPMSKQPRLPNKQQAFYQRQGGPPVHRVSLADRTFPSSTTSTAPQVPSAPAPLTAARPPVAASCAAGLSAAATTTKPENAASAVIPTNFNLHRVCNFFASKKEVVEIALALDPSAIRRKADPVVTQQKNSSTAATNNSKPSSTSWAVLGSVLQKCGLSQERYSYPINIAIQNRASMDVLELLVHHGKDVLVEKDGYERTGSLSIALCQRPCDLDLIDLILFANVQGIMVTDRKLNYPLHVACAKGASVDVIMRLYHHYPAALFQQNFNSETPLDICRRSSIISEGALNFLLERFNEGCLKVAKNNYQNRHQ